MDYTQFVRADLLVLAAALYGLGLVIKHTTLIKNNYIPAIITGVGVALSALYIIGKEGVTTDSLFNSIVQGIICASLAVFSDQFVKQLKNAGGE